MITLNYSRHLANAIYLHKNWNSQYQRYTSLVPAYLMIPQATLIDNIKVANSRLVATSKFVFFLLLKYLHMSFIKTLQSLKFNVLDVKILFNVRNT